MSYRYIMMDSRSNLMARALLESAITDETWKVRVLDDALTQVLEHEIFQLLSVDGRGPAKIARIMNQRDDFVFLEIIDSLDDEVLENLRVMTNFETFIYPVTGSWQGRIRVVSHNLSCGGISFFCNFYLKKEEVVEIVIPITEYPIILRAQVIRPIPSNSKIPLYAAKFINMVVAEDAMVREAVFEEQIQSKKKSCRDSHD